jgi:hypothetical protein
MSIKEMQAKMDEIVQDADQLPFDKIPPACSVEVLDAKSAKDKKGKDCLFIRWEIIEGKNKGKTFVSKYTTYHYPDVIKAMEALGISEFKTDAKMRLELKPFAMGYPRHLPVELIDD